MNTKPQTGKILLVASNSPKEFYTKKEAANYLKTSLTCIYEGIKVGLLVETTARYYAESNTNKGVVAFDPVASEVPLITGESVRSYREKKSKESHNGISVGLFRENKLVKEFPNIKECYEYLGTTRNILRARIEKGVPIQGYIVVRL